MPGHLTVQLDIFLWSEKDMLNLSLLVVMFYNNYTIINLTSGLFKEHKGGGPDNGDAYGVLTYVLFYSTYVLGP